MTWVAWRQFRAQAVAAVVLLGVIAAPLLLTHNGLVPYFDRVLHCKGQQSCQLAMRIFAAQDPLLRHLTNALAVVVPAVIGVFWGAPLIARELETGSFRLAWTQSVTRSRWMVVKLAIVGVASMIAAGLFSLMVTWWSSMHDRLQNNPFQEYDTRGIVLIGYAAFAFALGVTLGVILRRTLAAMAATLVLFFAAHISFSSWVRQRLLPPLHSVAPLLMGAGGNWRIASAPNTGDWVISDDVVSPTGRVLGDAANIGSGFNVSGHGSIVTFQGVGRCPNKFPPLGAGQPSAAVQAAMQRCANSFHLVQAVTYQPENRYWTFQWMELSVFLCASLLLAAAATWWVRRRLS